jgi:hypothetical protein
MKITRSQLRKLIMESSNFGEPGQTGYSSFGHGERMSLEMVMDDYIDSEDKETFDNRVLDAMEKYVNMYNSEDFRPPSYHLSQDEVRRATISALNQFQLQTGGAIKDDYRFSKSTGRSYPIDDRGNIKVADLPDDMSIDVYERALVEDNVKNLHGLLTSSFNSNLSVMPQGGSYDFLAFALSIPSSARGSIYFDEG